MHGEKLLNFLWSHQPVGYRFVVMRKAHRWENAVIPPTSSEIKITRGTLDMRDADLYFCPNVFSQDIRQKQYCLPSRVMYQDLDWADPRELPDHLQPEVWWETSPGRYQAAWILEDYLEPLEFSRYNRALNRACEADPGTWNLTRLLRVPGSWNFKRDCMVSTARFTPKMLRAA
jgi:hypothetical protein